MRNNHTTIINRRNTRSYDVYIGRGSTWGNPFILGLDGNRAAVIAKYRVWFDEKLTKPRFRSATLRLRGRRLGCWCVPLACHGDVIVEWLNGQKQEAIES